jgi:ferric-dicitrate binding protein FerR (iron transport regulator)
VVTEGSVEVHDGDAVRTLAAGNALTVQGTAMRPATPAERDAADAWRTGRLIVDNRPLGDVLPMLRRWYAMTVTVPQTSLLSRPVTLNASLDSSREAISGIEKSTGLEMGYSDSTMVFREPAAKKRK